MVSAAMASAGNNRRGVGRVRRPTIAAANAQPTAVAPSSAHAVSANCAASRTSRPSIHEMPVIRVASQRADRDGVDGAATRSATRRLGRAKRQQAGTDLGDRADDEQAGELRVLGVHAGGRGVDGAGADRRHRRDRQAGHASRRRACSEGRARARPPSTRHASPGTARVMAGSVRVRAVRRADRPFARAPRARARRTRVGRSAGRATTGRDR